MTETYFKFEDPITFRGEAGDGILSYRHYDPDGLVMGKRM